MQFDNSLPIYQQVVTAIKKEIAAGSFRPAAISRCSIGSIRIPPRAFIRCWKQTM